MRRAAFTLVEVLIAMVVFLVIATIGLQLWTGSARMFAKGEDALTTIQEASTVIMHLRRDLVGLGVPKDPKAYLLRYEKVGDGLTVKEDVFFDRVGRRLTKARYRSDSTGYGGPSSDRLRIEFKVFGPQADSLEEVAWEYRAAAASITRKVGERPPQQFAVPRLQAFDVQLLYQLQGGQAALEALGWSSFNEGTLQQMWFRVRFMVKAEDGAGAESTRVELESNIFPKHLHRILQSLWLEPP